MKSSIICSLLVLILLACKENPQNDSRVETLPYYNEATFTPKWFAPNDSLLKSFHKISPFTLVNQEGDTITEQTFKDKIYVVDFFFTSCPGICPQMTTNMTELQEVFLQDDAVLLLSHSVTPKYDTVAVLKQYAIDNGVLSQKWHLATGSQQEIYKLGRKEYFVEEDLGIDKKDDEFLHTENFVLIDKKRHIRGIYNGLNKTAIKQLIADINTLKTEG